MLLSHGGRLACRCPLLHARQWRHRMLQLLLDMVLTEGREEWRQRRLRPLASLMHQPRGPGDGLHKIDAVKNLHRTGLQSGSSGCTTVTVLRMCTNRPTAYRAVATSGMGAHPSWLCSSCHDASGCARHAMAQLIALIMHQLTGRGTVAAPEAMESQDRGPCVVAGSQPPCMCSAALRPDMVVPLGLSASPYSGVTGLCPRTGCLFAC